VGLRELIPCIARTAVAAGVDGISMEVWFMIVVESLTISVQTLMEVIMFNCWVGT
jgi:3-deoxy-D-arabino-heptulosonate 7-phosphate (DAHP) synthase